MKNTQNPPYNYTSNIAYDNTQKTRTKWPKMCFVCQINNILKIVPKLDTCYSVPFSGCQNRFDTPLRSYVIYVYSMHIYLSRRKVTKSIHTIHHVCLTSLAVASQMQNCYNRTSPNMNCKHRCTYPVDNAIMQSQVGGK